MTQLPLFGQPPKEPDKPTDDRVVRLRLLITVKAAPNPFDKYGETVSVAGLSIDPARSGWIRLYPIDFRELGDGASFHEYDIVSVDAVPALGDSRPESWCPRMSTLKMEGHLGRHSKWRRRRCWIDPAIASDTTMCRLLHDTAPESPSFALIRPHRIEKFSISRFRGWSPGQQARIDKYVSRLDLSGTEDRTALKAPRFSGVYHYACREEECPGHRQQFLDWEFAALQRKLRNRDDTAVVRELEDTFLGTRCSPGRETAFYVGSQAKHPRTFSVLGVYWPPRNRDTTERVGRSAAPSTAARRRRR